MIGKTISHYRLLEKLGQGGMGVIYKAEDTKLKRLVALKFLPPDLTLDEEAKERFVNEAQAASALDHPNLCTIYEIDEDEEGRMFIAMAYYEGETLQKKVASGKLQVADAIEIAIQIAQGLAKAHEHGIIHRDIKPANVMITNDSVAKILDFGLAKLSGQTRLTKIGTTVGTVAYMSPEQSRGENVDHRTDIWALGVVIYEMLTARLPFRGEYEQAVIYSIFNEEPEPVTGLRADLSSDFDEVIRKALAKDANQRYAAVIDFLSDLENLKAGIGIATVPGRAPRAETEENSIAVIDFTNIAGDATIDWLSGGIAETVTVDLKKISALKVVNREKVLNVLAKHAGKMPAEQQSIAIGKALGVRWMISGGYQKAGNAIRLTAHFTEIASGEVVGSVKADGTMEEIFKLQDQLILSLMEALQLKISSSEIRKIEKPEAMAVEAYEYYAKGRQLFNQFGKAGFEQAEKFYEKAIELDDKYALPYSGLGRIYIFKFIAQTDSRDLDIGISYLQKALQLDPDFGEPYPWLCYAYTRQQRFEEAIQIGRRAIKLEPDNPMAHYFLGAAYTVQAAMAYKTKSYLEAIRHLKRNIELQPYYQPPHMILGWIYMFHGQYPEAREYLEKAVAIEESEKFEGIKFIGALTLLGNLYFRQNQLDIAWDWYQRSLQRLEKSDHVYRETLMALTYCGLGNIHFGRGLYGDALVEYRRACEHITKHPKALGAGYILVKARVGLAKAFHQLEMSREAKQQFEEALPLFQNKQGFDFSWMTEVCEAQAWYDIASYHALAQHHKEALDALRKAVQCGWSDLPFLEAGESFRTLRDDAPFRKIVQTLMKRKPLP
ncbi:tetratricopeptide repeat protein [candidate division KSB1 bacterium]|nr:MAG: tetratricopeptide repeat protein [candidate division KSB1 bacterium]MBC6946637.1 tetratricopeptide repeat protein [candidate division KSB1 bacterium]MCE7940631.1 tetratricopeptide repeat protein [Chlorobi bacterium CHB1]MDL1873603.1 tetratricopeptide repeat protein [Cytophagia bacterium CHB2]